MYTYCYNNPSKYIDSQGNTPMVMKYKNKYYFYPDDRAKNVSDSIWGFVPFGGWLNKLYYKLLGCTYITKQDMKVSSSLDAAGFSSKIAKLVKANDKVFKNLKILGSTASAISTILTLKDVYDAATDNSWKANVMVDYLWGAFLLSDTKQGLIDKYVVCYNALEYAVNQGYITYTVNDKGEVTFLASTKEGVDIIKGITGLLPEMN